MTDDLVKRLRSNRPIPTLPHEAADRIEALTAEIERLNKSAECLAETRRLAVKDLAELEAEIERLLVSNEQWQVDYNEAVIDKLELETENHLLRVAAQRLGTYSAHDDDCRIMTHGVWSDPIPCTCGYTDAWQAHLTAIRKQP